MEPPLVEFGDRSRPFEGQSFAFFSHVDFNLVRFRMPVMKKLIESGADVYAICPPGDTSDQFEPEGIQFLPFEMNRSTFNPLAVQAVVKRLTGLLEDLKPKFLHTFTLRPNAYGALAGKRAGVPIIINTVTGLGSLYAANLGLKGRVARWGMEILMRHALEASSAVIFQNPDDREYYIENKLCTELQARLIIGSGVDVDQFNLDGFTEIQKREMRELHGFSESDRVVTMIARLLAPKGVYEYLNVAQRLSGAAKFVLIGDPDPGNPASLDVEVLSEYVQNEIVVAPGHQKNIAEWLSISDIFVLPSYREGLPRTVLEAMAMSLPIITTDVPGCRETVKHGRNGLLVQKADSGSLSDAIVQLIDNAEMRERMGKRSREVVVEKFSTDVIVAQYLDLYAELCQNVQAGTQIQG